MLVTVGTDGVTDWIKLPSGERLNLGAVSILRAVAELAPSGKAARRTLDTFLKDGEAFLSVNEEALWTLLKPKRARWSSGDGPFMPPDQRTTPSAPAGGPGPMPTIQEALTKLETHIAALDTAVEKKVPPAKMAEGHQILVRLAHRVEAPKAASAPVAPAPAATTATEAPAIEGLAYDTVKANESLGQDILAKADATVTQIEKLASEGKPFRADKAKADVHAVTTRVAGIFGEVDLTAPWVKGDLQKLAARMDHLHSLFFPTKQA